MTMQKYKLFLIWYMINLYIMNVREVLLCFCKQVQWIIGIWIML